MWTSMVVINVVESKTGLRHGNFEQWNNGYCHRTHKPSHGERLSAGEHMLLVQVGTRGLITLLWLILDLHNSSFQDQKLYDVLQHT